MQQRTAPSAAVGTESGALAGAVIPFPMRKRPPSSKCAYIGRTLYEHIEAPEHELRMLVAVVAGLLQQVADELEEAGQ